MPTNATNMPAGKPLGVFHPDQPDGPVLWVFSSVSEFFEGNSPLKIYCITHLGPRGSGQILVPIDKPDAEHTYLVKFISTESSRTFGKQPSHLEEVREALREGLPFPKIDGTKRECEKCGEEKKYPDAFAKGDKGAIRSVCKECRNDAGRKGVEKRAAQESVKCTVCKEDFPGSEIYRGTSHCHPCENKLKRDGVKKRQATRNKEEIIGKDCKCGEVFSREKFKWKQDGWDYRCRRCYNEQKYSLAYWRRQKEKDPFNFKKKMAEVSKKRREDFPEDTDALNESCRLDPAFAINRYVERAKDRGIEFAESEKDQLIDMLDLDCHWCGVKCPPESLHTLDRLDESYTLRSVVPSCVPCNISRGSNDPAMWIHLMHMWNETRLALCLDIDENLKVVTRMSTNEPAIVGRKEGRGSLTPWPTGTACYLCRRTDINLGHDRIDSSLSYVDADNVAPCCTDCNLAKKDFSLDACYTMADRITKQHRGEQTIILSNPNQMISKKRTLLTTNPAPEKTKRQKYIRHHPQWYGYFILARNDLKLLRLCVSVDELTETFNLTSTGVKEGFNTHGKPSTNPHVIGYLMFAKIIVAKVTKALYNDTRSKLVQEADDITEYVETKRCTPVELHESIVGRLDDVFQSFTTEVPVPVPPSARRPLVILASDGQVIARYESLRHLADSLNVNIRSISEQVRRGTLKSFWTVRDAEPEDTKDGSAQDEFPALYSARTQPRKGGRPKIS